VNQADYDSLAAYERGKNEQARQQAYDRAISGTSRDDSGDEAIGPAVRALASSFARELASDLTPGELRIVVRRNRAEPDSLHVCHSHDFCDANVSMLQAFVKTFRRDSDHGSDEDVALWNRAWGLAKSNDFWIEED
jgi:hypothetical protein